jgi:hypothetical protein
MLKEDAPEESEDRDGQQQRISSRVTRRFSASPQRVFDGWHDSKTAGQEIFDSFYKSTKLRFHVHDLRFLRPDVAVVHFDGRIMGAAEQWPEPATTDVSHSSYADLLPAEFGSAESSGNVL